MTRRVQEWLTEWAVTRPDQLAVADGATRWTYRELEAISRRLAAALRAEGIGESSRVATLLVEGAPLVGLVHALRRLGAVHVPLDRRGAPVELAARLSRANVAGLIFDLPCAGLAAAVAAAADGQTLPIAPLLLAATASASDPTDSGLPSQRRSDVVEFDAAATIIFTSGTTGTPKGAVLTWGNHVASADAWAGLLVPRPTDRWLAALPSFHVAGLAMIIRASRWGVPLVVQERFEAAAMNRAIEEGASHLSLVAAMLPRLLDAHGAAPVPPTLRAILLGGGPIPSALIADATVQGWPLVPSYGLTETASGVAALRPEEIGPRQGSAGRPLPGVELQIERRGRPARVGEIGEILVRGEMVFGGYDREPAATVRVLRNGWFHTGDLGSLDGAGYLHVADRRDDLIVSGGENVYPAEVEAVLRQHPDVCDAAVVGRPDPRWGAVPVAAVVLREGRAIQDDMLDAHCRTRLAGYKVPVAFRRVSELPRGPSGKILHRQLREQLMHEART